jgi:hypothetical protein
VKTRRISFSVRAEYLPWMLRAWMVAFTSHLAYSVLSRKPGGNQAPEKSRKERGRDKTCWTKPRSRTYVAAMRIIKWRSGGEYGAALAIDRQVEGGLSSTLVGFA